MNIQNYKKGNTKLSATIAAAHATVMAVALAWIFTVVAFCKAWYSEYGTTYPAILDTFVFLPTGYILEYPQIAILVACGLSVANLFCLLFLGHSRIGRVLRAFWSGMMLTLPMVLMMFSCGVLSLVVLVTYSAMQRSAFSIVPGDALQECNLLAGEWELSHTEKAGNTAQADILKACRLAIDVEPDETGREFTPYMRWSNGQSESRGIFRVEIGAPKRMLILRKDKNNVDRIQYAMYRLQGEQLQIIFSPPATADSELPSNFDTRDNDNELLVYRRKPT